MVGMRLKNLLCFLFSIVVFALVNPSAFSYQENYLRIGINGEPSSIDPHFENSYFNNAINRHIFETLVSYDKDFKIIPQLAESWSISSDGYFWTFKLRKGVKFHNGYELSADDVDFSFSRVGSKLNSRGFPDFSNLYETKIIDNYTIQIITPAPNPFFINIIAGIPIVSEKAASIDKPMDFDTERLFIGTGPYRFVDWSKDSSLKLSRHDNYWGERLPWTNIIFYFIKETGALKAAIQSHQIDLAIGLPDSEIMQMNNENEIYTMFGPRNLATYLFLNTFGENTLHPEQIKILQDSRVRTAIFQAINRKEMISGIGIVNAEPAGQLVPEGMPGFVPALEEKLYNPEKAKNLINEAGYPDGFELTIFEESHWDRRPVEIIKEMLSKVNIRANIEILDGSKYYPMRKEGILGAGLTTYWGGPDYGFSSLIDIFHSYDPKTGAGLRNFSRYTNPEIDNFINKAFQSLDIMKRQALTGRAMRLAIRDYTVIPLYIASDVYAIRRDYEVSSQAQGYITQVFSIDTKTADMLYSRWMYGAEVKPPPPEIPLQPPPAELPLEPPPTELPLEPPPITKSAEETKLVWNVWAEERTVAKYDPLPKFEKDKQYHLFLDLSALVYKLPGVTQIPPNPELEKGIKATASKTVDDYFEIIAFVLPDTAYFEAPSHEDRRKELSIDLNKIRDYSGASMEKMWRDIKQKRSASKYVFGHKGFSLTTRKNCEDGWASVAIILFRNKRPVDEVKAVFCVGNCKEEDKPSVPVNSSPLLVLSENSKPPDGALYFLELDRNKLLGLFLDNSSGVSKNSNYETWDVATYESLKDKIGKIFSELNDRYSNEELERTGRTLMQNIFGDKKTEEYKKFKAFVNKKIKETENRDINPSLFVRVVSSDNKVFPFIPLGLLLIIDDTNSVNNFFLGQHFRIISPLPIRQSYERNNRCIPTAVAFLPPDGETGDTALDAAKKAMGDSLNNFGVQEQLKTKKAIDDYLRTGKTVKNPMALLILSHHSKDRIWFIDDKDYLAPGDFSSPFGKPSIAVLNGCETAATAGNEFVNTFNEKGIDAVIATASKILGHMNGRFFFCFDEMNRQNKGGPLSQIFHDTLIQCLWNDKDTANNSFQANALKYVFLGNGDLTLCIE